MECSFDIYRFSFGLLGYGKTNSSFMAFIQLYLLFTILGGDIFYPNCDGIRLVSSKPFCI